MCIGNIHIETKSFYKKFSQCDVIRDPNELFAQITCRIYQLVALANDERKIFRVRVWLEALQKFRI